MKYNHSHITTNDYGVQFVICPRCNKDFIVFVPDNVKNALLVVEAWLNSKKYSKKSNTKSFTESVKDNADYVISGDWIDDIF
jgi:hypothetical protein